MLSDASLPGKTRTATKGGRLPQTNIKVLGIFGLLVVICVATAIRNPNFLTEPNILNLVRRTGLYGVLGIGVAFVIITGGIDLSIGSVVALIGCMLPWLLLEHGWPVAVAVPVLLLLSVLIGLFHGVLV